MRTSSFNKFDRERANKNANFEMKKNISNLSKRANNLDAMMEVLKLRSKSQTARHNEVKNTFRRASYRPYLIKNVPLKSKDTNSVLLATILDVVKDKKIVEYRIKSKKKKADTRILRTKKIKNIVRNEVNELIKFTKQNNSFG